ncbi:AAA family ATPase [Streptomyces scabiei]|uniref:AAA family ATPase n=1 Tax=Streptomyces scabiei TaxID=1930 RepID=UPI00298FB68B|nr:AAA family ATPase [Streptomyces scabiei]MDW8805452.1 AAA family ATPase [Streptomyces scabiei]
MRDNEQRWLIKSFAISGLGGRQSTYSKKLNSDVNIFFGLNGSGKTTLLRILHAAVNEDVVSILGAPFESAEVELYFPREDLTIVRSLTMPDEEVVESALRHLPPSARSRPERLTGYSSRRYLPDDLTWQNRVDPENENKLRKAINRRRLFLGPLPHRYLPISRLSEFPSSGPDSPNQSLDEYFAKSIQQLWSTYSAEVLGQVGAAQESGLGRILEGLIAPDRPDRALTDDFDPDKSFDRVQSFLRRRQTAYLIQDKGDFIRRFETDPGFKRVVLDINEVEEQIEQALEPRKRLEDLVSRLISGPKQISFENSRIRTLTRGNKEISLERLSSGEKQLLRILLEALAANGNPIIIDEPELSMHIDWQNVLIESIQTIDMQAQVITATHSPEIMAKFDDEKIFRL